MPSISLGWRARIGLLYPETGLLDEEYWQFDPHGVAVFIGRTEVPGKASVKVLTEMAESSQVERMAKGLALVQLDSLAYACTAAGFVRGVGSDLELTSRLRALTGVPATCTITAVVKALRALGAKRTSVATPYIEELDQRLHDFMVSSGFEILAQEGLGKHGIAINFVTPEEVYKLARRVDRHDADAVFIACTGLRTVEVLDALEADLGKPVVSANQATMWDALRIAGVDPYVEGVGRLFRSSSSHLSKDAQEVAL